MKKIFKLIIFPGKKIAVWAKNIEHYYGNEKQQQAQYLRLFLTLMVIGGLSVCLLSGKNPFRLLVPSLAFSMPVQSSQKIYEIYMPSYHSQGNGLIQVKKAILPTNDHFMQIKLLANRLTTGINLKTNLNEALADVKILPPLGNAIRQLWQPETGRIIIELSSNILQQELEVFLQNVNAKNQEAYYLDAFFSALTQSAFVVQSQFRSIEFFIDGKKQKRNGMQFDFSKQHKRLSN